jgi:lipid A 3-O-deacylase
MRKRETEAAFGTGALTVSATRRLAGMIACLVALWAVTVAMREEACAQSDPGLTNSISSPEPALESRQAGIWENGVGEGFRSTTHSVEVSAGINGGLAVFGTHQSHDLALIALSYGHMLSHVWGEGHWYKGNLELRCELFTGAQFSPSSEWFVGLTPHLRYSFATGTRWIPFVDVGAGVTATSIGLPDLSGTFEFNLEAGGGVQWFLTDDVALTAEVRLAHWSCAGIHQPNVGLNGVTGLLGLTYFF